MIAALSGNCYFLLKNSDTAIRISVDAACPVSFCKAFNFFNCASVRNVTIRFMVATVHPMVTRCQEQFVACLKISRHLL